MSEHELYHGPERRVNTILSEDQVEFIAERAAEKAIAKMTASLYQEIGKGVIKKILTLAGILVIGLAFWASSKGIIRP